MFEGVQGNDGLPDEFDDVTAEIQYPELTAQTTEKEFLDKAGNGYKKWAAIGFVGVVCGCGLFMWGMWELTKWF